MVTIRKRELFEKIHANKWNVITLIWCLLLAPGIYAENLIGICAGIIACVIFFFGGCFRRFKTPHNYALWAVGDTQLNITNRPGDFLIGLPGYKTVQEHGGKLLTTKEMKFTKKDVSFEYGGTNTGSRGGTNESDTDSVKADAEMNYYFDKYGLYKLITRAPLDFDDTLLTNACSDLSSAFQERIANLDEAQAFKDIKYTDNAPFQSGKFLWDNDKHTIIKLYPEMKNLYDRALTESQSGTGSTVLQKAFNKKFREKKVIPELDTTVDRAKKFGIHFSNITISGYKDSAENEALRSEAQQETYKNKRKLTTQQGNRAVLLAYKQDFIDAGYDPKEAMAEAVKQLARENGTQRDFNVSGGGAGVILNASNTSL